MLLILLSEPSESIQKLATRAENSNSYHFEVGSHFLNQTTVPNVSRTYGRNGYHSYE
jgi:hypothetical protein